MNEVKKIVTNKKFIIITIVIVLILLSVFFIIRLKNKPSQQEVLTSTLESLGIDFYENFYYGQLGDNEQEKVEFLQQYKDIGIKVSLDNLARYKQSHDKVNVLDQFVNKDTNEQCDQSSSKVVIYPKDPYGKTNYTIDTILVCGFEDTTETN